MRTTTVLTVLAPGLRAIAVEGASVYLSRLRMVSTPCASRF